MMFARGIKWQGPMSRGYGNPWCKRLESLQQTRLEGGYHVAGSELFVQREMFVLKHVII